MKTFTQFIEVPKKPTGPSRTPASDRMRTKHARQRDALADRGKQDKERTSDERKSMVTQQKGELKRAKLSDKSARLRKAAGDKMKKQRAERK